MTESSTYKSLFDDAAKLIEGRVNLDGRALPQPGFFEKRRLLKALQLLEKAAAVEPPYGAASLFAGKVHERLGNYEECVRWLRKAQTMAPDNVIVAIELGGALSKQGRHSEAIVVLTEAAKAHSSDPRVQSNLAVSLLLAGDLERSVATFKHLTELEPSEPMNKRLLNFAIEVHEGRKARPTTEAEIIRGR